MSWWSHGTKLPGITTDLEILIKCFGGRRPDLVVLLARLVAGKTAFVPVAENAAMAGLVLVFSMEMSMSSYRECHVSKSR